MNKDQLFAKRSVRNRQSGLYRCQVCCALIGGLIRDVIRGIYAYVVGTHVAVELRYYSHTTSWTMSLLRARESSRWIWGDGSLLKEKVETNLFWKLFGGLNRYQSFAK